MDQEKPATNFDKDGNYIGPDTLSLQLLAPLMLHEKDPNPITVLELSEPTVAQMGAFQAEMIKSRNEFEAGALLISLNASNKVGLPQAKKIRTRDFQKALDFLTGFIQPTPPDGNS